ncbi:MAG TPA: hypothetical protein VHS80_00160 [Chthoniobacterales bacterium]|nr:hypothetical protein [Chthoniobacterales bacterium]
MTIKRCIPRRITAFVDACLLLAVPLTLWLANVALADVVVCPLEEAMKRLEDYNVTLNAKIAQEQMPILTEMQAFTQKAKNPALPTGAQLAKADQDRFQQLREQMLAFQAQVIVNSGYLRDSRVIARAAKIAHDLNLGRTIDEKDPDFFYYSIVVILSMQRPKDQVEITTPQDKECSVVSGLHFDEQLTLKTVNQLPYKEASDRLKVFAQRYGLDTNQDGWVERIPNLPEKQSARLDMGTVAQGQRMLDYINNIENLKSLARVSILGFQSDMEDIRGAHTEQELSKIGLGWTERAKNYDERTQILAGLLNMIAQKVPSDSMIETQGRTKALQQQGIIK